MIVLTTVTTVKNVLKKGYFLSTFGKSYLTQLTTNVMFSGQRFAILAMFFLRDCVFFWCEEVAWFFV